MSRSYRAPLAGLWRLLRPRRRLSPALLTLLLLALTMGFLVGLSYGFGPLGPNFHAVVEGRVYRSAQPSPGELEELIVEKRLRTVIRLREREAEDAVWAEEAAVCARHGVQLISIPMRASALPSPPNMTRLVHAFDGAEYPLLFHCTHGADRSGLAGVLYLHLYEAVPLRVAERSQLSWRYGHLRGGKFRAMDDFFTLYRRTAGGVGLREWILHRYPSVYRRRARRRHANRTPRRVGSNEGGGFARPRWHPLSQRQQRWPHRRPQHRRSHNLAGTERRRGGRGTIPTPDPPGAGASRRGVDPSGVVLPRPRQCEKVYAWTMAGGSWPLMPRGGYRDTAGVPGTAVWRHRDRATRPLSTLPFTGTMRPP